MSNKNERLIKYLGLGYDELVADQIKWAKIYFPESAKDLESKASSARMMVDLNAFVGDILSFYIEDRFRNSNLETANDISSIVSHANSFGYKFRGPTSAAGSESFYLEVPAITGSAGNYAPDMRYAINFRNVQLQNNGGITFEALSDVDFRQTNISSSAECKVSRRTAGGVPTHFVLKTNAPVMAGKTVTETFSVGAYVAFKELKMSTKNVLQVLSVKDSEGYDWYEVDYLAQDLVFEGVRNFSSDSEDVPYVLKMKSAPRRFITKLDPTTAITTLVFGNGKSIDIGNSVVPDPALIALDLKGKLNFSPTFIDPQNFLNSRTLGLSPYDTTITVKLRVGGGRSTNTAKDSLTTISSKEADFSSAGLSTSELNNTLSSFSARNLAALEGGEDTESPDEIKINARASHAAQGRVGTRQDYIARIMSMPAIFGSIFRVYPVANCSDSGGVQIYILSKTAAGKVSTATETLKKNIKNYLSLFTRMNQGVDLLDGEIINIGVEYNIVVSPGYNKSKVKLDTINKLKDFFQIDKWSLNQPILIDKVKCLITETDGVVAISDFSIISKSNIQDGNSYSSKVYDIEGNTKNNIIFCIPNGIFEVKFPDTDIKAGAI